MCHSENEIYICSLTFSKNHYISKNSDELNYDCLFYGISDRYALFGYSEKQFEYGDTNFDKILLIDSEEKKVYNVNPKIENEDSLLRFDMTGFDVFDYNDRLYFTAKTGAIHTYEKNEIFKRQKDKNKFEPYADQIETLVCFEVDSFVKSVKENNGKLSMRLIDRIGMYGSIELIGHENSNFIYVITDFETEKCTIKKYNVETKNYKVFENNQLYEEILVFNNNIYGVLNNTENIIIYNIITKSEVFRYRVEKLTSKIVYIDDQVIILGKFNKSMKYDTIIYNIETGQIIDRFENREAYFHNESDTLILYNSRE